MAILKIARMGHPVLRRRAEPVADPTAPEIRRLIEDMVETMIDAPGAGLAAPQVHVPLRLVIFRVPAERITGGAEDRPVDLQVLINPEIEALGAETTEGWEGCLSVPGLRGSVPRHARIRYRGLDQNGEPIDRIAAGFHARVVQHECDHLDGVLYPQRMKDLGQLMFESELRHYQVMDAEAEET
ncbi:MAG: peptide deformylase [Alphaproteobacteria bacterium]|nr:peptide deformylase [Alphaproteobacteria bacterium]